MIFEITGILIKLATIITGERARIKERTKEDKKNISNYLMQISICLGDIANNIESGKDVQVLKGALSRYMKKLMDILEGVVVESEVNEFTEKLNDVKKTKEEMAVTNNEETLKIGLAKIRRAAGEFKGLADEIF